MTSDQGEVIIRKAKQKRKCEEQSLFVFDWRQDQDRALDRE